jgi:hypothetical protein
VYASILLYPTSQHGEGLVRQNICSMLFHVIPRNYKLIINTNKILRFTVSVYYYQNLQTLPEEQRTLLG